MREMRDLRISRSGCILCPCEACMLAGLFLQNEANKNHHDFFQGEGS